MYGGDERRYVAYVGIGDDLRRRVRQHLVDRNSSVTTGTGAVGLNADHVRSVEWWENAAFSDRVDLAAAELVAFDVLEPALRSRGGIPAAARQRATEAAFREEMVALFRGAPAGRLTPPSVAGLSDRLHQALVRDDDQLTDVRARDRGAAGRVDELRKQLDVDRLVGEQSVHPAFFHRREDVHLKVRYSGR